MDIFLFSFFLHFSSLFSLTTPYSLPDFYFINCGSTSSPLVYGRNFAGDEKSAGKFTLSSGGNSPVESPGSPAIELYKTARVFRKSSFYELDVDQTGRYVVRFHFYPFPSMGNISDARFSVLAYGLSLLSDFTVQSYSLDGGNNFPLVEEFLLEVGRVGKLRIDFVPYNDNHYFFAFVNAIELFMAPEFAPHLTGDGELSKDYSRVLNGSLHAVHRINVGGPNIMPNNDTLLRYWVPDDDYLLTENVTKNSEPYSARPKYQSGVATEFDAPDFVYRTAKELVDMDRNRSRRGDFNISWRFDVKKGTEHLVRVHFCDVVSQTTNELLRFNLYIYSKFSAEIYPYGVIPQPAAPFYCDFVVRSDDSGFLNISVGPSRHSGVHTAFLNGVEIMELVKKSSVSVSASASGSESKRKRFIIIIGSVVGGAILIVIILTIFLFCLRKKKWKPMEKFDWPLAPFQGGSSHSGTAIRTVCDSPLADLNLGLKLPLAEILYATKRFNTTLMVGEGGFGKVYKGTLRNGTKVAVKRSEPGHGQGLSEFETEIMVLSKIRHHHLVSLIGYCDERDEMILVYEFMEKGTLQDHLYAFQGESSQSELSWEDRLRICIGAAKGLHYLHTGSSGTIIHRDIKSTNILLDEHFVAKVADFGISRSGPLDQTHVSTDVKGSFGYLDPEYFKCLQLTQKSDVYSFGVVLLEVLCARPVIDHSLPREQVNLADWGIYWQNKGELDKIVDPLLVGRINPNSLRKFGETVEKCLEELGADRPNMVDVLWDLEYCLQLQNTTVIRETFEDSSSDVAWGLPLPVVQRLPSNSAAIVDHDSSSFTGASRVEDGEVFSQLKFDEAR